MQQTLAPHLFHSLEILQLPLMDLQQMIKQELSENPTLEAADGMSDVRIEIEQGTKDVEREEFDNEFEKLAALGEEFGNEAYANRSALGAGDAEEKYRYVMDSLTESSSLHDQLLEQLAMSDLSEYEKKIAEIVVGNVDDDGYLRMDVEELMALPDFPAETFDRILSIIHEFDPPGVGARDLRECLLIQLRRAGREASQEYRLVADHLDLLAKHKYDEIARGMHLTPERIRELAESIARLDPKPGRNFGNDRVEYVVPEIIVEKRGDDYVVIQNRKPYPRLFISRKYLRMIKDPSVSKEVKTYLREKIAKSKQFIQSIDQRMSTIYRIAKELVRIQRGFFDHGVSHLKPLNMRTVAELLDVHETTVSRAISGKYVQTPRGLFPMKYFFTPGVRRSDGEAVSNRVVKDALARLVKEEDRKRPYSDSKLAELLKEQGIGIARRTVAKYRDQLRILPSHLRKER